MTCGAVVVDMTNDFRIQIIAQIQQCGLKVPFTSLCSHCY